MPDRATIEAARPKCPAWIGPEAPVTGPTGHRCAEPMRWAPDVEAWVCPLHGRIENGESAYEAAIRDA